MLFTARIFLFCGSILSSASLFLTGCATQNFMPGPVNGSVNSRIGADGVYALSSDELDLSCNKLKGRIQLRILEVRDRSVKQNPTSFSTSLHQAANNIGQAVDNMRQLMDNSQEDSEENRDNIDSAHDVVVMNAYNQRLRQLGCAQYDISTELDPKKSKAWKIK